MEFLARIGERPGPEVAPSTHIAASRGSLGVSRRGALCEAERVRSAPFALDLPFTTAFGVTGPDTDLHHQGDIDEIHPLASVSKPIAALAVLVAIDRALLDLSLPALKEPQCAI